MKPLFLPTKLLSVTALIFVLNISEENLVGTTNKFYESCEASSRRQCGDNQTISFPFFIQGSQDRFCGFPNFQISCNNGNPIVKLSGDDYVISKIFYHNQSLIVSNFAFSSSRQNTNATTTCFGSPVKNLSLPEDDRFSLVSNQTRVSLFYNHCLSDGCYELDRRKNSYDNCSDYLAVEAPVLDDRRSHIGDALRGGFMLTWTASDCSYCEKTEGKCGFDFDKYQFRCFCPDQPHAARCGPPQEYISKMSKVKVIVSIVVLLLVVGLVSASVILLRRRAKKKYKALFPHENSLNDMTTVESLQFDFKSIQIATNNFSEENKLGKGGFGEVYKGTLLDGREIAVKRLSKHSAQGEAEFKNEVVLVAKLQHRNLARLFGFCLEGEEKLLIYEYVPNSSLDSILFDTKKQCRLNWSIRCKIIEGIARGVMYLHEDSRLKIIHRDLKASNVLLDNNMNAKVSDFGMAKMFVGVDQTHGNTKRVVGTYGYMAPEYAMEGLYSIKSDVYSFGVLLLEILSGRRNSSFRISDCAPSLVAHAWQLWKVKKTLDLIDSCLKDSCNESELLRYTHIGLLCVQEEALLRPSMSSVVLMLKSQSQSLSQPQRPAFIPRTSHTTSHNNEIKAVDSCSVNGVTVSEFLPR